MSEKILFFDAGPIISLIMSRLHFILPDLKKQYGGKFCITPAVKYELVDRPLTMRRFKFESLQVLKMIRDGTLEVYENVPLARVKRLSNIANSTFKIQNKSVDIMQLGEMQSVACAIEIGAPVVIDERTLRLFIEKRDGMKKLLHGRFHHNVEMDSERAKEFSSYFKGITIIRSVELVSVAYKLGFLNSYIPKIRNGRKTLVDSVLWATKVNGCAVTEHEIEEIKDELLKVNHERA